MESFCQKDWRQIKLRNKRNSGLGTVLNGGGLAVLFLSLSLFMADKSKIFITFLLKIFYITLCGFIAGG